MIHLRPRQVRRSASCVLAALLTLASSFIAVSQVAATTYTWDGNGTNTGNGKWSTAVNWDANGVPVSNLTTTDVVFGGTFHLTPLMDANYSIHQLTFASGAGAFNLSSNSAITPETLTIGTGGITNSSSNVQSISSPLALGAAQTWNASTAGLTINSSATVSNGGFLLTISGASNTSIASVISGTGGLTKNGVGILTLNGTTANTYTGLTTVNAGELDLGKTANVNAIGSGGLTINAGTVKYTGTSTDEIADTANVTLSGGTLDLNNHADTIGSLTFNSGTLTSTGGTQILTLAGSTGATLQMQGAATIPTSVNLAFSSTTTSGVGMTFDASSNGTATINGNINLNNTATTGITRTFTINDGTAATDTTIAGVISNTTATGLTKVGAGTLVLSGANTYTGATTISAGTLQLGNGGTTGSLSTSSTITDNANFTINRSNAVTQGTDFSGSAISGTGSFTQAGSGATTLTAANSYTGATTISAGTLQLGNGGITGSLSTSSTITDNGNLTINRSNAVTQGTDFSGSAISGTGSFTQAGSGTTTLTAANSYTGATAVNAGTLLVNGSTASASAVTVANSSTVLGGTGTINGTVAVNSGATINPGPQGADGTSASVGTLTTGALTLASTATFHGDAFGTATNEWDKAMVNGTATLGSSTLQVIIASGLNFTAGDTYTLIDANAISGTFNSVADNSLQTFSGYQFIAHYDLGGDGNFELEAVPEPSTWFAAALALAAIGFSQRKHLRACARVIKCVNRTVPNNR